MACNSCKSQIQQLKLEYFIQVWVNYYWKIKLIHSIIAGQILKIRSCTWVLHSLPFLQEYTLDDLLWKDNILIHIQFLPSLLSWRGPSFLLTAHKLHLVTAVVDMSDVSGSCYFSTNLLLHKTARKLIIDAHAHAYLICLHSRYDFVHNLQLKWNQSHHLWDICFPICWISSSGIAFAKWDRWSSSSISGGGLFFRKVDSLHLHPGIIPQFFCCSWMEEASSRTPDRSSWRKFWQRTRLYQQLA